MNQRYASKDGGEILKMAAGQRQQPVGDRARLLRGSVLLFILGILAAGILVAAGPQRAAANDAPVINGSTATYSGNQQPDPITQNQTNIYTINVQNLTTNVGSSSTDTTISLTNTGEHGLNQGDAGGDSQALLLSYSGGNYYLYGLNYGAYLNTTAGSGHDGGSDNAEDNQHGGDGGVGGTGGAATVTTSGAIQVSGTGIEASSNGGAGGDGGDASGAFEDMYGGHGGDGGDGGAVTVTTYGAIQAAAGILALSNGGDGGDGGDADTAGKATGGHGDHGGAGGTINVTSNNSITISGDDGHGIQATSKGGKGGTGGVGGGDKGLGGDGGDGGAGGSVIITTYTGTITTSGANSCGIFAQSLGGAGGTAGEGNGTGGNDGGTGGAGGTGGSVTVTNNDTITTSESASYGIWAQSLGGAGGTGGESKGISGDGGDGGNGGNGGSVAVNGNGVITTSGENAHGIYAQSSGGQGGGGGAAKAAGGDGGHGGTGGNGGDVQVTGNSDITVTGNNAYGLVAQSSGGAGSGGGSCQTGTDGNGGHGGAGGTGGSVTVTNTTIGNIISCAGFDIYALSSGGDGGSGGLGGGTSGQGGHGGAGGTGGSVMVTNDGTLTSWGEDAHALVAISRGGAGGGGGTGGGISGKGGDGGTGGNGGSVQVTNNGTITTTNSNACGIYAQSIGGAGGSGGQGNGGGGNGGNAGDGGNGGSVTVTNSGTISTRGAIGINAESMGGAGQDGAKGVGVSGIGGNGGNGGTSGQVTVNCQADITTSGQVYAINAVSSAGNGGNGGDAGGVNANGGNAGAGGNSTTSDGSSIVSVTVDPSVTLTGGILAASIAGAGGKGHSSDGVTAEGGDGGAGGASGGVQVTCNGNITVNGVHGILAQSIGGIGGDGGDAKAAGDGAGKGGAGGAGGEVNVNCSGNITVSGDKVHGILAQSQGGSGGDGGSGYGAVGVPGDPGASAVGGSVNVTMTGSITTSGVDSCGILAQSIGGVGGGGGGGYGLITWGAAASGGADGGAVTVNTGSATDNTGYIKTQGTGSTAILAQSIGGGGGNGGSSGSLIINLGGAGAAGGDGGSVSVTNYLQLTTAGDNAYGIQAQSLGGGGGNGGGSVSVGVGVGLSMGGSGGPGGDGGQVSLTNSGGIATSGASAYGIFAQSLGGGGGAGGYSVTAGEGNAVISIGGSGGSGGDGAQVSVANSGSIATSGASAYGIFAQSVGGGGGAGGYSVAVGIDSNPTFLIGGVSSTGGSGGSGGDGGQVSVTSSNAISTSGDHATGILAQSVGGGGGAGGYSVTAGASVALVGIGGSGGNGGKGGEVGIGSSTAYCSSDITTTGVNAQGILAQSLGGGGGAGGWTMTAGVGITAGIGGSGGSGGDGGVVNVYTSGAITTSNDHAQGILAQSVGGGGGNGGFSFAGNITPLLAASFSLGGSGNTAGSGAAVTVNNSGSIATGSITTNNGTQTALGYQAHGILAQSVGGGGGNAGWAGTGTLSFSVPDVPVSASMAVSLGGAGGSGGDGGDVTVNNLAPADGSSTISTIGDKAHGIFAQSVGGGGGSGGGSVAAALDFTGSESFSLTSPVSVGGQGGNGGTGGQVAVINENAIITMGKESLGILAQSVGGGGGEGGWSVAGSLEGAATQSFTVNATVAVGGSGGDGGDAGEVQVTNRGAITTSGQSAIGIEAQSVGGGGGNGGWSIAGDAIFGSTSGLNFGVSVGGSGGGGGNGGAVTVTNGQSGNTASGAIATSGDQAQGILAQSIGGGGGNGGATALFSLGKVNIGSNCTYNLTPTVSVGGSGGVAGSGGQVTVNNYADISTAGTKSYGIEAQSVGGGGGNGGSSYTITLNSAATKDELSGFSMPYCNITASAAVGGHGGDGNHGGAVSVTNAGGITTQGTQAYGIFAQSVGGGGGVGGDSYAWNIIAALSKAGNANNDNSGRNVTETISVGGDGGGASNGGAVTVSNSGAITTSGSSAYGIFAQSVGGGGGVGGSASLGISIPFSDYNDWKSWVMPSESLAFQVGGNGGSCGNGGQITVGNTGAINTSGDGAFGIYAQSLGGGGGVASYDESKMFTDADNDGGQVSMDLLAGLINIGGTGGAGGDGGEVTVTNSGVINTSGKQASGIYAQSIGGGGGKASVLGGPWEGIKYLQYFGLALNCGRSGGSGGDGGDVTVTNTADITTQGENANGIFAQSIGGAGGSGSTTSQYLWGFLWNGSIWGGASGDGGAVTVKQTGNVTTYGADAHGIVAQSIAGNDHAGNVAITLNDPISSASPGNIITNGLGSCGIVAQSLGAGGNGNIDITINQPGPNSGLVQGGSSGTVTNSDGSTITYNAYGVLIMDGKQNTLTNYGSISTLDGAGSTAVMVEASYGASAWGDLTVNNFGTITGSINQGTQASSSLNNGLTTPTGHSTITFNNYQGRTYNAGPVINLGGGTLTNSGLLSLGTVQSTLTGNYTQTGTGIFQTTVNGDGTIGQLNVSGTANLAGTLQVLAGTGPFKDGISSSFLTGTTVGNFTNLILPASTSLVDFSVQYTGAGTQSGSLAAAAANAVQIVSHVKSHTTVAKSSTETVVGGYLDRLLAANPTGSIAQILAEFQRLAPSQFHTAFESLTPAIYGANTDTTFTITRQYTRTLQQRLEALRSLQRAEAEPQAFSHRSYPLLAYNGANASLGRILGQGQDNSGWSDGRLGVWIEGFGQWGSQGSVDRVSGYNYGLTGTGIGLDYVFTKNLILGANFGYSYSSLNMDNSVGSGKINSLYGSLYGTYFTERAYVEGVFSYGNHRYDNSRRVSIGALQSGNQSSHTGNAFSLLAEAGYKFPVKPWNLQPFASLSYCHLSEGRVVESGEVAPIQVSSRSTNSVVSELGIRVDRPLRTSKGILVPMLKASWQHDFGVSQNSLPFSLIGAPTGTTITHPRASQDRAVVRAGLTFKAKGGITSSIQYMGEVGEKTQNHGVIGQVRLAF